MNKKNILLITIDSLRADAIKCINHSSKISTPNFDELAKKSVFFTNAISAGSYTTTSVPSILTGEYPSSLPLIKGKLYGHPTPEGNSKIAKILKRKDYKTSAFHSNPLLSRIFGYKDGFDSFYDDLFLKSFPLSGSLKWFLNRIRRLIRPVPYLPASKLNKKAIKWLKKTSSPWFLWLHYMDPHGPYQIHQGFPFLNRIKAERVWRKAHKTPEKLTQREKEQLKEGYRKEVEYTDKQIGKLLDKLKKENKLKETIIIVTADHGEGFGDHGFYSHPHYLYDELLRVPLFVSTPGIEKKIVSSPVSLVNLVPTILELANLKSNESFDGKSLSPLIKKGDKNCLQEYIISESEFDPFIGTIRGKKWKFIKNGKEDKEELYNLKKDPREKRNLLKENPEIAKKLRQKLKDHVNSSSQKREKDQSSDQEMNQEIKDKLRSLGYID